MNDRTALELELLAAVKRAKFLLESPLVPSQVISAGVLADFASLITKAEPPKGSFVEFIRAVLGTREWVIANRLPAGYKVAISSKKYGRIEAMWNCNYTPEAARHELGIKARIA